MADNLTNVSVQVEQDVKNEIASSTEKVYLLIWAADSPNPGYIDHGVFLESHVPEDHNYDEVVGPHRVFVEVDRGSDAWKVFVDPGSIDPNSNPSDWALTHLDIPMSRYDWATEKFVFVQTPAPTWDDVKNARNAMLSGSDSFFNIDTPEPLRSEWLFYREQLRQLVDNEKANGRTPGTVHWPLPPYPTSARSVNEHAVDPNPLNTAQSATTESGHPISVVPDNTVILHRPANFAKYGARASGSAGGVDDDPTHLMELVAQIRQEVADCKGVPAQSIAPSNQIVHSGDPAHIARQLALNTNTIGEPSNASNTMSNPANPPSGLPLNTDTSTNVASATPSGS
jgi:hypothetical protein